MTTIIKNILGDGGSIELLNHMGSDLTVVNAARVSMNKWHNVFTDADIRLINYLAREGHWTPFAQCVAQFRIKMPIFVARQYYRHTVGLVRNEMSRRYVDDAPEYHIPDALRLRAENVKQGSSDEISPKSGELISRIRELYQEVDNLYSWLIGEDIAPEQAREVLPQATYTEFIETGSLYAYSRIYHLRRPGTHAQKEIWLYAAAISDFMRILYPYSWAALTNADRS